MSRSESLPAALLVLRVTLAGFFLIWSVEKILAPELALRVFETFYFSSPSTTVLIVIGVLQTGVVLAFLAGVLKTWTYGLLLAMHAVSTASSWERLINPYEPPNHLFWAAIPVLGALVALFLLRRRDTLLTLRLGARRRV